jgi:hypothetical protein
VYDKEMVSPVSFPLYACPEHPSAPEIIQEISMAHHAVTKEIVNWWLRKMPEAYFRCGFFFGMGSAPLIDLYSDCGVGVFICSEIDAETRMSHLRALIALQMTGQKQEISLLNKVLKEPWPRRRNRVVLRPGAGWRSSWPCTDLGQEYLHLHKADKLRGFAGRGHQLTSPRTLAERSQHLHIYGR